VLDQRGQAGRQLAAGTGLVAATRHAEDAPVWVVTGTDAAGVDLAARSLQATVLRNHFAVALTAVAAVPLPEMGR
jgi:pyruvate/2-oxoacid:ferredoxin oxidoreductase beta subunit